MIPNDKHWTSARCRMPHFLASFPSFFSSHFTPKPEKKELCRKIAISRYPCWITETQSIIASPVEPEGLAKPLTTAHTYEEQSRMALCASQKIFMQQTLFEMQMSRA